MQYYVGQLSMIVTMTEYPRLSTYKEERFIWLAVWGVSSILNQLTLSLWAYDRAVNHGVGKQDRGRCSLRAGGKGKGRRGWHSTCPLKGTSYGWKICWVLPLKIPTNSQQCWR